MFGPTSHLASFGPAYDQSKQMDKLDPMQNQLCRVCDEPAAGFHFGAFTCEGCKSFFGRTSNNQSVIQECKNNYRCIINKKNRTACKACRLRKCLMVGMSKSGSRYGRRSNWFKIHCLMQQAAAHRQHGGGGGHNHAFDIPSSGAGGMGPPSLLNRSVASSSSLSPSYESKRTEIKSSKPTGQLWRPLEPSSPPSDHEQSSSTRVPFSIRDATKLQANPPHHHFMPTSASQSVSPPHHLSSPSSSRPPIVPDLSQLFRLHGCYSMANYSDSNQDSEDKDEISHLSPLAIAAAAAANASAVSRFPALYSAAMGSNPLAFLPPTFNIPALSALPLHKQMLLSPLLASSHLWASARKAYPFLPPTTSPVTSDAENVLAEHKALLERFRSTFSPPFKSPVLTPSSFEQNEIAQISDDDSSSMAGGEAMPHLSDTEEEEDQFIEEDENENESVPKDKKT